MKENQQGKGQKQNKVGKKVGYKGVSLAMIQPPHPANKMPAVRCLTEEELLLFLKVRVSGWIGKTKGKP